MSESQLATAITIRVLICVTLSVWCVAEPPVTATRQSPVRAISLPKQVGQRDVADRVRDVLEDIRARQQLVGLQAAVSVSGKLVFSEAFGWCDLEHGASVTTSTRFAIASITKAFTAAALLRLREAGEIDLDAPIQRYVPRFPTKPSGTVTPRLLALCQGGIRHYRQGEKDMNYYARHFDTVSDALVLFKDDPLVAIPGNEYHYTSYGYNLLAAAIEAAAGTPFESHIANTILKPLALRDTRFDDVRHVIPRRTRLYSWYDPLTYAESDTLHRVPIQNRSYNSGGGNMLSSAKDLVAFGCAFLRPGFVSEESLTLIRFQHTTRTGKTAPFGFGWFNWKTDQGERRFGMTGNFPGVQASLIVVPANELVIAILTNTWGKGAHKGEFGRKLPERIIEICLNDASR